MRSLVGLSHWSNQISGSPPRSRVFIAKDYENQVLYTAFEDDRQNVRVLACETSSEGDKTFVEVTRIPIDAHDGKTSYIVNMTYIAELRMLCLALRNGDITLISKERFDSGQEALEIIGTVDTGINAMSWSPDQDLVVVITGAKNVLEMTLEFETITEFPLHVEEQGEGVQHSVGWGKKETQFHGSAGKQAALNKVDTSKFTTSEDDDECPRIAWRGDGSYFVCSDVDPRKGARVARIYNREGILQNTSEPVDRLEHVLDWRPSGNLIVSSQRLPHRHDIVFFERNGLRHGEFTLRESREHKVLEVFWNSDSTVLAIWLEIKASENKYKKSVQLWTMNNYHWYLKQHIVLPGETDICGFHWDSESPLCAHIADSTGVYHRLIYTQDVITSTSTDESNPGYVAVIDGSSILLTPFSYQNVPPPMCSLTLSADDNVQMIAFGPTKAARSIAAVTTQSISFYELPENGRGEVQQLGSVPVSRTIFRQLQWIEDTTIVYAQFDADLGEDLLVFAKISLDTRAFDILATQAISGGIGRLYHNLNIKDTIVEDNNGKVYKAEVTSEGQVSLEERILLPTFCTWIATTRVGRKVEEAEDVVLALTERGKLYGNDRLLSSECTSFFLRNDWLAYTTTSHTARFLPLDIDFENFKLDDTVPDANDESYRRVERGSKIVLATQSKPSLVLQMPRGNLETINPRAFVLASIRENLQCLKYRTAFLACRRNRIDLNILFDEDPQKFFENVPKFIEQIPEVDHLNLFLSNLRDDDSTLKIYHHSARPAIQHYEQLMANKVNKVCQAFREVLMERGRDQYIQSILSTYVKSNPPDLESALSLLAEIRETDINAAEEALQYTIFLCDAEKLYNVALGMYNFPLVLMVAQQAQKDPREYLPFLQGLQKLERFYQRYKIDDHLKRYEKALRNLSRAGDEHFDELLQYMQRHMLYLVALDEYNARPDKKKIILDLYGEYLVGTNVHLEAGIIFKLAKEPGKALNAYKLAGAWREVFALAGEMAMSEQEIQDMAYTMIEHLKDKRRYQDAAIVANEYAKDVEEAIECLLKGSHWQEALRLSYSRNRADLIETHVKPGLIEGFNTMNDDIDDMVNQFNKQTARLKELREKKPELGADLPPDESLDNIDMFSDTTSMYSQFTRYTQATSRISTISSVSSKGSRKTSKLRRKEQRKRERGKKGTIFEEEYLVNSLKRLYERASNLQADVHELLCAMVPIEYIDEAKTIQTKFSGFLESLGSAVDTIFVPLRIAAGRYASPEEYEAFKEPVIIEKPKIADHKWKLEILLS